MKFWVLSDLHMETAYWRPPSIPDADICIAAGDIGAGSQHIAAWAKDFILPHMPLIVVPGNHEYYSRNMAAERRLAQAHAWRSGFQILDDMTWTIGDTRFIGSTLWTDYDLYKTQLSSMRSAAFGLNDHRRIQTDTGRFSPLDALAQHKQSVAYLESVLAEDFAGETVVITHHVPHPLSVHKDYEAHPLTPAFASDLSWLIEKYQPSLWIHGHTHKSFDYHVGSTRIVCNPHGYGYENRDDFDPALVVEIGGYNPKPRF